MQRGGSFLAQVALVLALSVSGLALNSHRAAATDYTTTQKKSLADGDTITTTGLGVDGLRSDSGTIIIAPNNNTITTDGKNSFGLYARGTGSGVNATNVTVITTGEDGQAAAAYQNGTTIVNGGSLNVSGDKSYGGWASSGGTVNLTDVTITSHSQSDGGGAFATGASSKVSLDHVVITTTGSASHGIYVTDGGSLALSNGSSITTAAANAYGAYGTEGVLTIQDSTISTGAASAVYYTGQNAGSSLLIAGSTTDITASGADAVVIAGGRAATIGDGVKITAKSDTRNGITVNGGGVLTIGSATVSTEGTGSSGLYVSGAGSSITATGTLIETKAATGAVGVLVDGGGNVVLNNANISTVSANGYGVRIAGANSSVQMNAATSITTTGTNAHGVLVDGGATKTFTSGNSADALPGRMSIGGDNAAAFMATSSGSSLTFDGINFATASTITLGTNSWTAVAGNSGIVELKGNTVAADTRLRAQTGGTLKFSGAATAPGASVQLNGATSTFDATGITSGQNNFSIGTLSGDGRVNMGGTRLNLTGGDSIFSGVISGTNGLRYEGTGTLTLSGANTFTGNIGLISGTVSVSSDASLGGGTSGINFNGGTLKVTGNSFNSTARAISWVGAGGFDIDSVGNTFTVSQNLGAGGALTKTGAGTLVLSGTNTYTGGTNINGGTLVAGSNSNLGDVSGSLAFDGGTLSLITTFDNARSVTLGAAGGTIETAAGVNLFSGTITGTGELRKTGTGTLVLTGDDTATGLTTIVAGTLRIGNGSTKGSIAGNIVNDGAVSFDRIDDVVYGGVISGSGVATKNGAGTLTLTSDQTYTGATVIAAGTLQVGNGGASGWISNAVISNNGRLSFNRSDDKTYAGSIVGSGSVIKNGTGTLTLSGTNTYTGGTEI
ncbi:beta strand repeat-containing protein, partial [Brucella anthropi]|uniref:beta strand repeat-containing protein n=1 Tax=Brucella anthropi TaxID=529 RepID=UPI002362C94B